MNTDTNGVTDRAAREMLCDLAKLSEGVVKPRILTVVIKREIGDEVRLWVVLCDGAFWVYSLWRSAILAGNRIADRGTW